MKHKMIGKKIKEVPTLKQQFLIILLCIIVLLSLTFFPLYYNESTFVNKYNQLIENILHINRLNDIIRNNQNIVSKFIISNSRNYIPQLNANKEQMNLVIADFENDVNKTIIRQKMSDLKQLTRQYTEVVNTLIFAGKNERAGLARRAQFFINQILMAVKDIHEHQIEEIRLEYQQFTSHKKRVQLITALFILAVTILSLMVIIILMNNILRPIKVLTATAREVSNGNFKISEVKPEKASAEILILSEAFNHMTQNIRHYILELNQKVDLERRLKEEEVTMERYKLALKEAELMALQSQVNPHFMFNTLNIIAKIAYLEEAEKTITMISAMSRMLRYSLGNLSKIVTLGQEIANLDDYIFIQKTRFADRLEFIKQIDGDVSTISLPCMTIQPLVENAVLHGIENKESGGIITLRCYSNAGEVRIVIDDNGVGIKNEILAEIFNDVQIPHHGHSTGLGINNVRERLELFFDCSNLLSIQSKEGEGTRVTITIPDSRCQEGDRNV